MASSGGSPRILSADVVEPKVEASPDIVPKIALSEDLSDVKPPKNTSAQNLVPVAKTAVDIRPKIVSAKEG